MNTEQKALGRKILEQVERDPESLDMASWEAFNRPNRVNWKTGDEGLGCGTTRCMAGWAVHFAARDGEGSWDTRRRIAREAGLRSASHMLVGAHLLGLTESEADTLFLDLDEREAVAWLRERVG